MGLPPGIPLARIAGPWVTRKLGGRRRRPRLRNPISDTGPPAPKPCRGSWSPSLYSPPRAERGVAARSLAPFVGRAPPPFGGSEVAQWEPPRGGGELPGQDSERRRRQPGRKVGKREKDKAASGDRRGDSPLRSMRRAPSRARALAQNQRRKSLAAAAAAAAVLAASMAARPAARGG